MNSLHISQKKLARGPCGSDRTVSAQPTLDSLRVFSVKDVYSYMVRECIYNYLSRSENIFIRQET